MGLGIDINDMQNMNVDMENESDVFITNMINHDSAQTQVKSANSHT